jgi:hypothetical protein
MLGMIGTASLVAQTNVYSINAVGYINLTVPVGYSIVACQLLTGTNTIANLFNNSPTGPTPGLWNGSKVLKYNKATGHYDQNDIASSSYSSGWIGGGTITVNPGEAIWFDNGTGSSKTVTFVGTVPQGTNTVAISTGYQMISSPVPFSGDLVTNMGFTNYANASKVLTFDNPGDQHYTTYLVDLSSGTQGYMNQWDSPDPVLAVGQGFWYSSGNGPTPWVQVFSINP